MRTVELTQGQVALVDDEDYDMLMAWKWYAQWSPDPQTFYAKRSLPRPRRGVMAMHTQITGWRRVDHIDHNGLNNQRSNLREVTRAQNNYNRHSRVGSSEFKGVSWYRQNRRWVAAIQLDGVSRYLGSFKSEGEAARAYDAAARELYGEYANLNFPLDSPS